MREKKIHFTMIYIDEAHDKRWPIGLDHPDAHENIEDRLQRANEFLRVHSDSIDKDVFTVFVDNWNNDFGDVFQSWPDKYYCFDRNYRVLHKSEYGAKADALVNLDCLDLIKSLI